MFYKFAAKTSLWRANPSGFDSMSSLRSYGITSLGVIPNVGVREAGHQHHKRSSKSGAGCEMAKYRMRRVNTELVLKELLDDTSWKSQKYSRRDCVHKIVRGAILKNWTISGQEA